MIAYLISIFECSDGFVKCKALGLGLSRRLTLPAPSSRGCREAATVRRGGFWTAASLAGDEGGGCRGVEEGGAGCTTPCRGGGVQRTAVRGRVDARQCGQWPLAWARRPHQFWK